MQKETFSVFVKRILLSAIPEDMVNSMTEEEFLEEYFRRAFTHRTFFMDRAAKIKKFDYEVLEKIGDRALAVSFQVWLYEIIGHEVKIPQPYSDMEKNFTGTEYLSKLTELLGFDRWIQVAEGNSITPGMKEDVFEAFIGAIILSADRTIARDIGLGLAKRWIFAVYNKYARQEIDPRNTSRYVDYVSRVNEIWLFRGWGAATYKNASGTAKDFGVQRFAAVNLEAPNRDNFPEALRGQILGTGNGYTIKEAKEEAARKALETLNVNFYGLRNSETEFDKLEIDRLEKLLVSNKPLLNQILNLLNDKSFVYQSASVRHLKLFGTYVAQLRIKIDDVWKNAARATSETSTEDAVEKVFKIFLSKAKKGDLKV